MALRHVARNVGRKIKFVNVAAERRAAEVRAALDLLAAGRVVHLVHHSSANGVPLGAEVNEKRFKALFLDCGLANRVCGLPLVPADGLLTVNEGALAEQFAGQELLGSGLPFEDTPLFYWHREARNANAEVDYVISLRRRGLARRGEVGRRWRPAVRLPVPGGEGTGPGHPAVSRAARRRDACAGRATPSRSVRVLSLPLYLAGQVRRLAAEWA